MGKRDDKGIKMNKDSNQDLSKEKLHAEIERLRKRYAKNFL